MLKEELIEKIEEYINSYSDYYEDEGITIYANAIEDVKILRKKYPKKYYTQLFFPLVAAASSRNSIEENLYLLLNFKKELENLTTNHASYYDLRYINNMSTDDYNLLLKYLNFMEEEFKIASSDDEEFFNSLKNFKMTDLKRIKNLNITRFETIFALLADYMGKDLKIAAIPDLSMIKEIILNRKKDNRIPINFKTVFMALKFEDFFEQNPMRQDLENFSYKLFIAFKDSKHIEEFFNVLSFIDLEEAQKNILHLDNYANVVDEFGPLEEVRGELNHITGVLTFTHKELLGLKKQYEKSYRECYMFYKRLINNIRGIKDDKFIYSFHLELSKIGDEEIKANVMYFIYTHNLKVLKQLKEENRNSNYYNYDDYKKLLLKYNINYDLDSAFLEKVGGLEVVEDFLKYLKNNRYDFILNNKNNLEEILRFSSVEKMQTIRNLIGNNPKFLKFIQDNLQVFTIYYEQIVQNIEFLNKKSIELKDLNILFEDLDSLEKHVNLAECYKINLRKKETNESFLKDNKLYDYFDNFIELGYYTVARNNLELCGSNSEEIIKRLLIANTLDLEVLDKKKFDKTITDGKNFCVPNNMLDRYLFDDVALYIRPDVLTTLTSSSSLDVNYDHYLISWLDENFWLSDQEYAIDEIIISRYKVKRYFKTLLEIYPDKDEKKLLFYAIIYNSKLSLDKIDNIWSLIRIDDKSYQRKLEIDV